MNNYYTLHSLVSEVRYEISGKEIIEVWSSRKEQIDLFFRTGPGLKLTFSAASPRTALFLDARAAPPSQNAASFFPEIHGLTVADVLMPSPEDRYIQIVFKESDFTLLFKPFGSRPNLFMTRGDRIVSSFKQSNDLAGTLAPEASGFQDKSLAGNKPQLGIGQGTSSHTADHKLEREDAAASDPDPEMPLRKRIISIDKRFPRGLIDDLAVTCRLEELDGTQLATKIREIGQLLLDPQQAFITAEGNLSLLPEDYLAHPPAQSFKRVNDAVRTLFFTVQRETRLQPGKKDLLRRLERRISGLHKQLEQLDKDSDRLAKADQHEQTGHLLMSQPSPARKVETDQISVADWSAGGRERIIPVIPGESLIHQAQQLYAKASRIRKDVAMSLKKRELAASQLQKLQNLLEDVSGIEHPAALEKWLKKQEPELRQLGLASTQAGQVARPYRLLQLGDYDVWIGKNAKSNDKILALSHKEDIWMHARGSAGSHLVIRTGGDTGWPDPQLVRKAASWAAAYSKQAGSSLVPVMVAKRKHVRKPKGAAPGEVTVTRERVEMAVPQKPDAPDSE